MRLQAINTAHISSRRLPLDSKAKMEKERTSKDTECLAYWQIKTIKSVHSTIFLRPKQTQFKAKQLQFTHSQRHKQKYTDIIQA